VPADGFYEWQKLDAKNRQPWAFALADGALFAFAGLWDRWKDKTTQQPLETFTILTTEPNELTASIHNRMPVILAPQEYERWLEPGDPARLPVDLLRPRAAEEMTAWRVGQGVGNVRNNDPSLCMPA
jgi:putative SOS response-associated peptidase YedK